jgi:S1-C subfamily serine protease
MAQPVYDGAVLKGLQISAGLPPGDPAAYGLERGDVVTAIEGSPVADPVDAWQQLAVVAAVHGSVTVRRAGKVQSVRLLQAKPVESSGPTAQVAP